VGLAKNLARMVLVKTFQNGFNHYWNLKTNIKNNPKTKVKDMDDTVNQTKRKRELTPDEEVFIKLCVNCASDCKGRTDCSFYIKVLNIITNKRQAAQCNQK